MSLALARPGRVWLTDEARAWLAAEALGVPAHGTVGILIRSSRRGRLDVDLLLEMLAAIRHRTSLHIRAALLDEIIDRVRRTQRG